MSGQVNVLTWHNDNARTGQNLQETVLTPANVNSATFGRLAVLNVDGKVDAQPLYVAGVAIPNQGVHNVLYVATEHGSLYAFDADTFAQLRQVSLIGANETPSDDHGCSQVTPEIGITATPAIDLQVGATGMIYAIAQSKDTNQHYHHRLHALDLPTLTEQLGGPVEIRASYPGSGAENTFNPAVHTGRPGLLISNGVVYTSWGSHCDAGSYAGWVLSYNAATLAQVGVLNLVPNGNDGGIWGAGSGPASDANGNVYLLTGNGTFEPTLDPSGFPSKSDFGNAFVKISTAGALAAVDYFTMLNTVSESAGDVDLGSGGLMLLPPMDNGQGTGTLVSLVVGAGKDKNIYVLDQSNLGRFNPGTDSIYQLMSNALPGGAWSSPAWFNGQLYYGGVGDNLRAFAFMGGRFLLASHSSNTFPYPGTTPSISANGMSNGIVWTVENQNTAVLHAYDATNVGTELYNSNQAAGGRDHFGSGNKFIVPTIANGKVYVGTTNGVGVFGLLAGNTAAPPSIHIDSPAPGSTVSGVATVAGWAIDNTSLVGTAISSVQVLVDGVLVGSATYGGNRPDVCSAYPGRVGCPTVGFNYSLNLSTLSAGQHTIAVSATDSDGTPDVGTATVTITVANRPPSVYIDSPSSGMVVSGMVPVSGWALDNSMATGTAINNVQVKVDGVAVGTATYGASRPDVCSAYPGRPGCPNVGFTFALNTAALSPGAHLLTVAATDSDTSPDTASWSVTIQVAAPPSVHIDAPAIGSTISGTVTVAGWAIDNVSTVGTAIGAVQVKADGVVVGTASYGANRPDVCAVYSGRPGCPNVGYSYALNTGSLTPGTHTITVAATDTDGIPDVGSTTITVTVSVPPPSVHIDSPANGATVSGIMTIAGWAIDNVMAVGTAISTVHISLDGAVLDTATYGVSRPDVCAVYPGRLGCPNVGYTYQLNTSGLRPGPHTLTVTATDTDGSPDTGAATITIII
jgi:hypothetical protein